MSLPIPRGNMMSLKAFHIFFMVVSIIMSLGTGAWGFYSYGQHGGADHLAIAIVSLAAACLLAVYARWFLRKLKNVSYV